MASCYICGCNVKNGQGYRRSVLVNEKTTVYFTKRSGGSYARSHALRTLCERCACNLDARNKSLAWKLPISFVMSAVGVIGAMRYAVASTASDSVITSLTYAFFLFGGLGLVTFLILSGFEKINISHKVDTYDYLNSAALKKSTQEEDQSNYDVIPSNSYGINNVNTTKESKLLDASYLDSLLLTSSDTPDERSGLRIFSDMLKSQKKYEIYSGEELCELVIWYSENINLDAAKEFVSLLGRYRTESIDDWFARVEKLAPYELNTNDATNWLTYVIKMSIILDVELWFGLNQDEEEKIKTNVLASLG